MKKLFLVVVAAFVATIMGGCGTSMFPASNTTGTLTDVKLSEGNFYVVKNVTGRSSATYIFGIGGLSRKSVRENAVERMIKSANLKGSQTIANVYVKSHVSTVLGIYTRITYTATGEVIEFYGDGEQPKDKVATAGTHTPATSKQVIEYGAKVDLSQMSTIGKDYYEVGDIYNDGDKCGIVFYVSSERKHGKIINPTFVKVQWCINDDVSSVGARDNRSGKNNMEKIMSITDWQSKFPAFAECAKLGDDWYIPSVVELFQIYSTKDKLHSIELPDLSVEMVWSSTEYNKSGVSSMRRVCPKTEYAYMLAIAEF